ncbi:threonine synthase [Kribbella antibiotica]|uniref:Threonine synthase n=1 Tax=Kribbella antibiotica TaxID=190195 RepID=A0A4R4YQK0_9ACTN|nr:threonine synthase [Kribbella antibiotica]TDD47485.1 threonine synthase [Kribbella antibiotica]
MAHQWRGVIEEYRDRLPVSTDTPVVTLGEGGTPLVAAQWLSEQTNCEVWLKVEGNNPTGSFKDRGMTMAISLAAQAGDKAVVCASTGNTSASAAAYAVRAGMLPLVLIPAGRIAKGKLAQAVVHGAKLVSIDGSFDDCLRIVRELGKHYPVALVNSVNPVRLEGQKTAAFEVVDALGDAPDLHLLPVGNAGNIAAYWKGYQEYAKDKLATKKPQMWGFQAEGAAPIVRGAIVEKPDTVATAIRVGNPASWTLAENARDESGGRIEMLTDQQILDAQRGLAAHEGVFVEPASAAGAAGLLHAKSQGWLQGGSTVVITVTGHGLKDIDTALDHIRVDESPVTPANTDAVARVAGLV